MAHRLVPRLAAQRHVAADVRFVDLLAPGSREPVPLCARIIIRVDKQSRQAIGKLRRSRGIVKRRWRLDAIRSIRARSRF